MLEIFLFVLICIGLYFTPQWFHLWLIVFGIVLGSLLIRNVK